MADKPEMGFPAGPPPTRLEITDLVVGEGDQAKAGQNVTVHYVGVAYSTGEQFDASYDRDEPFVFPLGRRRVIAGGDQGVAGMRVGGRRGSSSRRTSHTVIEERAPSSRPARR